MTNNQVKHKRVKPKADDSRAEAPTFPNESMCQDNVMVKSKPPMRASSIDVVRYNPRIDKSNVEDACRNKEVDTAQ